MIQAQFKAKWIGINADFSGRPGTSTICNKNRVFTQTRQFLEEEVRSQKFAKIFDSLRNIETDYPLLISSLNDRQSRTQQNFFQKNQAKMDASSATLSHYHYNTPVQTFN